MIKPRARYSGFTLIEVLVAVAVVGIALAAIIKVGAESGYNLNYLRDRTMAQWIASDRLTEMQAMEAWGTGRDRGKRELAGRAWYWETEITNTPIPRLRQITVRVYDREGGRDALATLQGLLNDPQLRPGMPGAGASPGTPDTPGTPES
jgi:general secretion pathway protein I